MEKKWLWVFVLAAILEILVNGLTIWRQIKMIDKTVILQIGLATILIFSLCMYIVERCKEFRKKIVDRVADLRNKINETKKEYALIEKIVDRVTVVEKRCGVDASDYARIDIYGESKDKKE